MAIPVEPEPIVVPPGVEFSEGPAAEIVAGGLDRATVTIAGLSIATRLLLAGSILAGGAMVVVIALACSASLAASVAAIRSTEASRPPSR